MTRPIRPKNPRMVRPKFLWLLEHPERSTAEEAFFDKYHFFPEEADGLVVLPPPKCGEPTRTPPKRPWPYQVLTGWTLFEDPPELPRDDDPA